MTVLYQHDLLGRYFVLATLLFAIQNAHALTPNNISPTSAVVNKGLQHDSFPRPTAPPQGFELRIRQQQKTIATCGFIEGASDSAVTCGDGLNCAVTSTFIGCCDVADCRDIITSCFDMLGGPCDQACQANAQNLVCPTSLPYCAKYQYEGGSIGLGCAAIQGYTKSVLLTSITGDPGVTPLVLPSPNTTTSTPSATSSPLLSPTSTPSSSSGLSTGATAGIAVGVTLGVVAVAIVAFIFYRRRKNDKAKKAVAATTTTEPDRESKALSELYASPKSPTSPTSAFYAPQPSPGPPHYSQHNDGQVVELPDNARPLSYGTTTSELGSSRM